MDKIKLKNIVEAVLIASDRVLSLSQLEKMLLEKTPTTEQQEESAVDQHHAANDEAKAADIIEPNESQETETPTPELTAEELAAIDADDQLDDSDDAESSESTSIRRPIKEAIESLQQDYTGRAMELKEVASGYRFQVRQGYAEYVSKLWEERPAKYSRALLETLVLIAYRQPITRGEIEAIRGVSVSSHIVKTLVERDWIRVIGHRDVPGKPAIFGTTKGFLDYFNLKSLDELPPLADIKDLDKIVPELALGEAEFAAKAAASLITTLDPDVGEQDSDTNDEFAEAGSLETALSNENDDIVEFGAEDSADNVTVEVADEVGEELDDNSALETSAASDEDNIADSDQTDDSEAATSLEKPQDQTELS